MKFSKILPILFAAILLSGCAVNVDNYKLTNEPTSGESEPQQNTTEAE